MTSEDFYIQAITQYLPYILLQNQLLIRAIEKPEELKHEIEQLFVMNDIPYPETEGLFNVEPIHERSSGNRVFLITIPRPINDVGWYPYMMLALTQTVVRLFLVSTNSINYQHCLWELSEKSLQNCGEVSKNKEDILEKVFELLL